MARLLDAIVRRWHVVFIVACGAAFAGFVAGFDLAHYTATVKLVRNASPAFTTYNYEGEVFKLRDFAVPTLIDLMKSPGLVREVAGLSEFTITPEELAARSQVVMVPNTELIALSVRGKDRIQTTQLANIYASEAIRLAQALQSNEVQSLNLALKQRLSAMDAKLTATDRELTQFQKEAGFVDLEKETPARLQRRAELENQAEKLRVQMETTDLQITNLMVEISRQSPVLVSAQQDLDQALLRFTEEHPKVKELRSAVAAIERQIAERGPQFTSGNTGWSNSIAGNLYMRVVELRGQKIGLQRELEKAAAEINQMREELAGLPEKRLEYTKIKSRYQSLIANRDLLATRQQEVQLLESATVGYYRLYESAKIEDLSWSQKLNPAMMGVGLAVPIGLFFAVAGIFWVETMDRRIRSKGDLMRATQLPILAALGDLREMNEEAREQWAFRTLTLLKGTLKKSNEEALVCGFTSSTHGEGRSTWIRLLAEGARKQGYSVLTVATDSLSEETELDGDPAQPLEITSVTALENDTDANNALMTPSLKSVVRVPVPAWAWNVQRREQWRTILQKWNATENLIVFVELPPASRAESVLLAEKVPQVIWLCGQDMANMDETRAQLDTLRLSRSNVVCGVLNHAKTPAWRKRFSAAANLMVMLIACLAAPMRTQAMDNPSAAPVATPVTNAISFSAAGPDKLADWQKHLTLGPGDVLNISLYEQPDSAKLGIFIGPDDRLTYLQAQDIQAAGLTVDELRVELEKVLSKYYRSARVIIIPAAYNSKKYFILGNVNQKGVFPLDRPTTIVEAIARARGFVSVLQQRTSVQLADLSRSFMIRRNSDGSFQRVSVDFEALFLRGDLNQNQTIAPDDYLFFPPADLQEVYVLGEVRTPGVVPYTSDMSALKAITTRGGFNERAFKSNLLIVRGSLNNPETFVVSASKIYNAKEPDFRLKPRDIVYVYRQPWSKASELLESVITDFARSAVITWTGQNIGPLITSPFMK
jgi:protein involved in polysaccharide export with SLBB domain/uncharacterized protein involved in exopolysaccharide biosynthesis